MTQYNNSPMIKTMKRGLSKITQTYILLKFMALLIIYHGFHHTVAATALPITLQLLRKLFRQLLYKSTDVLEYLYHEFNKKISILFDINCKL